MNDLLPNMMMMMDADNDNNNNNNIGVAVNGGTNNRRGLLRRRSAGGGPRRIAGRTAYLDPTLQGLSNIETMEFEIMKFSSLKYEPGEYFITSPISCHGHKWRLKIYPYGEDDISYVNGASDPDNDDCYLGCYLMCCDASTPNNLVKATWTIHLGRDTTIDLDYPKEDFKYTFVDGSDIDDVHGNDEFVTRGEVITDYLDKQNGSLVFEVDIQVHGQKSTTWYPQKTRHQQQIPSQPPGIHYLESSVGTDITFLVGGSGGDGCGGTPKTKADDDKDEIDDADANCNAEQQQQQQQFDAHKCILFHRAPGLYEFVKDDNTTSFDLPDVSIAVFKILLDYIYAGKLPKLLDDNDNDIDNDDVEKSSSLFGKELLLVSDRFNLILLKLHIESEIVADILNPDNAAEWLLFADAHSCPYLKESCMDIYADHLFQVKSSEGWKSVKESSDLLEELLEYYAMAGQRIPISCTDFDNMTVRSLREELESFDLDLDGTREMLIQRLKDHHQTAMSIASAAAAEEEEEEDDDDDEV